MLTKQWVLDRLKEVVERTMQAVPVLDREGKATGEYTFQAAAANRALELLGKELGMFTARREEDLNVSVRMTVDRPPEETREQWLARRSRELGVTIIPMVTAARPSKGGDSG